MTSYTVQGRVYEGIDRNGKRRYTNIGIFSDRREQPGFFIQVVGITEPVEVLGCSETNRQANTFRFKKVMS